MFLILGKRWQLQSLAELDTFLPELDQVTLRPGRSHFMPVHTGVLSHEVGMMLWASGLAAYGSIVSSLVWHSVSGWP